MYIVMPHTERGFTSDDTELMKEYQQDAQRTHESHAEKICPEERAAQCSVVGELVFHNFLGHIPSEEKTGEQSS